MAYHNSLTRMQKRSLKSGKIKKQRQVTEQALKMVEFEDLAVGDDDGPMESITLNEFKTEKFLL